jgi:hypothetical protein
MPEALSIFQSKASGALHRILWQIVELSEEVSQVLPDHGVPIPANLSLFPSSFCFLLNLPVRRGAA